MDVRGSRRDASRLSRPAVWVASAASAGTSVAAHAVGSGMRPSVAQLILAGLACGLLTVLARLVPRRTGAFAVFMLVGQLVSHLALTFGERMTMPSSSGPDAHLDVAHHSYDVALAAPQVAAVTHSMLLTHAVGTLLAVVIAHLVLTTTRAAARAVAALVGRFMVPRVVSRRFVVPVESLSWARALFRRGVAVLRGPPQGRVVPATCGLR